VPEVACENLVTVGHKGSREAMEVIDMQHKQLCNAEGSVWVFKCDEMTIFGK
jgi:hypothetical protein